MIFCWRLYDRLQIAMMTPGEAERRLSRKTLLRQALAQKPVPRPQFTMDGTQDANEGHGATAPLDQLRFKSRPCVPGHNNKRGLATNTDE